jgi:tetratricopeptide (TPR) repeat protein
VIWLDANAEKKPKKFERTKTRIRRIVNYLKPFNDVDECIAYITDMKDEKIFFIVSGKYGKKILPVIHDLPNIESIYIFCLDKDKHAVWSEEFNKVRGIFVERESLLVQLTKDISDYVDRTPITVIQGSTTQDLKNEQGKSMWFHILLYVLLRLPDSPTAKTDMINECLNQYRDNKVEQRKIEEFRNQYKCEDAIRWYTRDSFVYRLINKALRTENIDRIFLYRFFIIDLYKQLKRLHDEQFAGKQTLTLYRGQNMHAAEFEKIQNNINGCISVNTFLSTTSSSIVANDFSGNLAVHADSILRSVIFQINVDSTINKNKPFARISEVSVNSGEHEYLFTMGTVFKILSVEEFTAEIWYVTLEMVSEEHEPLKNLFDDYKASLGEESSLLLLGELLSKELDDYKRARHYYELLIRELPEDDINVGYAYSSIAVMLTGEGNYEEALSLFKKAKKIYSKALTEETQYYLAEFYIGLAGLRQRQNNYKAALKLQKKALKIRKTLYAEDNIAVANTYKALASSYHELDKFSIAVKYYKKSDEINQQQLPENHPIIGSTLRSLGDVYNDQGNYNEARKYYEKALHILLESMPTDGVCIAECYLSLGRLCLQLDENQTALENFKKGLAILLKSRPENDTNLVQVYTHIGSTYKKLKYPNTALKYYKKALTIIGEQSKPYLNDLLETYCHLLYLYFEQDKYSQTLKYCRKILQLRKFCENKSMNFFAQAYDMLGHVYCIQKKGKLGLMYCKRALKIRKSIYPNNHPSIADSYHNMAFASAELKKHNLRLNYALKALTIRLNPSTDFKDEREIVDTYHEISNAHISLGDYPSAVQTFTDAQQYMNTAEQLANNYFYIGNVYFDYLDNYETAKDYYEKALKVCKDASLENWFSETYWALGKCYQRIGDGSLAMKHYRIALSYGDAADNSKYILAKIHHSIATFCEKTGKFSKALKRYHKASSYGVEDECFLEELYHDMAVIYEKMDSFDETIKYYRKVVNIHESHSGECEDPSYAAGSYIKMGVLASTVLKDEKQLIKYTEKALSIYEHLGNVAIEDKQNLFIAHNNLGDTYMRLDEYGIALEHLETAKKLATEIGLDDEHPQVIEIKTQITSIIEQALTSSISKR